MNNTTSDTTNKYPVLESFSELAIGDNSVKETNTLEFNDSVNNTNYELPLEEIFALDDKWNSQMREYIDRRVSERPTPRIPLYLRKRSLVEDIPVSTNAKPAGRSFISIPASRVWNLNTCSKTIPTVGPPTTAFQMNTKKSDNSKRNVPTSKPISSKIVTQVFRRKNAIKQNEKLSQTTQNVNLGICNVNKSLDSVIRTDCLQSKTKNEDLEECNGYGSYNHTCFSDSDTETVIENKNFIPKS